MVHFIGTVLGLFIDVKEAKKYGQSSEGLDKLEQQLVPANARRKAKEFLDLTEIGDSSDIENPITLDDLQICVDKFLKEETLMPGANSGQLRSLISKLNKFNPNEGKDMDASDRHDLFAKKVGLIFYFFGLFIKDNIEYLISSKNSTRGLDGDTENEEGTRTKNRQDANKVGVEAQYNLHSSLNLPREMYFMFFDTYTNMKQAKTDLLKLYNIYLKADSEAVNQGMGGSMLLGNNISLTDEEMEGLKDLIDYDYLEKGLRGVNKSLDSVGLKLEELLIQRDSEVSRVVADFFTLLVKCNYKLKVKDSPYFNNFDIFKNSKITSLEEFRKVIESTKLIRDEYSEFPLLKDYSLNEVLELERNSNHNRRNFTESLTQRNNNNPQTIDTGKLDPRLVHFLQQVIQLRGGVRGDVDKEIIEDINRDTITSEDIKVCIKVLGILDNRPNEKDILREFSTICDLMNWKPEVRILDMSEPYHLLERRMNSILNSEHRYRENKEEVRLLNPVRLANLWKIIKNVNMEIIAIEDEATDTDPRIIQDSQGDKTEWGVNCWDFRGQKIPKVEIMKDRFRVRVLGIPVTITSRALDKGTFVYRGQTYSVTIEEVIPMYEDIQRTRYLAEVDTLMREALAIEGVDIRYETDSIVDWITPALKEANKVKKKPKTKGTGEEGLMSKEYFKDIEIKPDNEDMGELDLFF